MLYYICYIYISLLAYRDYLVDIVVYIVLYAELRLVIRISNHHKSVCSLLIVNRVPYVNALHVQRELIYFDSIFDEFRPT